ncbi:hypothetical protein [Citreimonas salinaria]|uniref:Uncharacterized protein n=1 Tax=Citreimonas salinaria TaxID=321339 RepID=A0A1H3HS66_9RHOB|nr:hypothetical protein [Citreimonas salinaria]SDY18371.1 hypothetical protein SAMN05444340_104137 [Citreimonas salinaria]
MTDTNTHEMPALNPRIANLSINVPPMKMEASNAQLLATFTVLAYPIRVQNVRLVKHQGEIKVWCPSRDFSFISAAKPVIIEAAMNAVREGLAEMDAMA